MKSVSVGMVLIWYTSELTKQRVMRMRTGMQQTLRDTLGVTGQYVEYCREERNFVAVLYAQLLHQRRLASFLDALELDPTLAEGAKVYVEYAALRDMWYETKAQCRSLDELNARYRRAILLMLGPLGESLSLPEATQAFNEFFLGCGPRPVSKEQIQMPSRWNDRLFVQWRDMAGGSLALAERICLIKFAFNAKPDLVIELSDGSVVCIEAKLGSGVGRYTVKSEEAGHCMRSSQIHVQEFLFNELLQLKSHFVVLSGSKNVGLTDGWKGINWQRAFDAVCRADDDRSMVAAFRQSRFINRG